jgi:hypothetical protein
MGERVTYRMLYMFKGFPEGLRLVLVGIHDELQMNGHNTKVEVTAGAIYICTR